MPSVAEFFPSIENDLTKVTWARNFKSYEELQEALERKVMMINGDVTQNNKQMGIKINRSPIICIGPSGNAAMSLEQFLQKVVDAKSVGVKLNFKTIEVFEESIKVLKAMSGKIKFPLWLNAVTDRMEDKYIDKFLSLCTHNFPKATISIGMLHKGQKFLSEEIGYSPKIVTQMKDTLTRKNVTQTVAFPVKYFRLVNSVDTLSALKDVQGITDSALYIYAGDFGISEEHLRSVRKLIKIFGKDRVYLDILEHVRKQVLKTSN